MDMYLACDLCGSDNCAPVLSVNRLDGDLACCRGCGLFYVNPRRADFTVDRVSGNRDGTGQDAHNKKLFHLKASKYIQDMVLKTF